MRLRFAAVPDAVAIAKRLFIGYGFARRTGSSRTRVCNQRKTWYPRRSMASVPIRVCGCAVCCLSAWSTLILHSLAHLKLNMWYVCWWKPDKFDCNGHVSIMAVVRFGGETAIWGTYDGSAQSSELSGTWSGSLWRLSSGLGPLCIHLRDIPQIQEESSTNTTYKL